MFRIVASDMDQTLLDHSHKVPQANIDAIRKMRELGCLFVPASGRSYVSVMESLESVPFELLDGSYLISYNGGCVNRIGDEEPLVKNSLPFDRVAQLFAYGLTQPVSMHVYELAGKVWTWALQPLEERYLNGHMAYEPLKTPSIEFLRDVPLAKILYCIPNGSEKLRAIDSSMPSEIKQGCDVTFSSGRYLEFVPEGVNKGSGLRTLAKLLGIDMTDTIACGDAANDESMVRAAGVGVAVANAVDGLGERADYFAHSTCDDGILAEVVEKFVQPSFGK
ncbi:MAG: Cof-type HAD-IIB family hydrolase [Tractidigestivibacter sp.]|jgi:Cof subfamily protein (haloacid dehalogenase superfamily)|uniref:Cof-type HAD-IIB family hydrolase n=1 Tax=Tractidigestivibacter sp. TaxID=2847320 RepID=UPI003D90D54A